jgi:hypothetical protein
MRICWVGLFFTFEMIARHCHHGLGKSSGAGIPLSRGLPAGTCSDNFAKGLLLVLLYLFAGLVAVDSYAGDLTLRRNLSSPSDCSYHDPELTISPSYPRWAAPGTPIEFTVIVTNTSSTQCDPVNFDVSVDAPSGWKVEPDIETLQIASDWSTGVLEMVIASPLHEQDGSYDITVTASNKSLAIESAATATYVVDRDSNIPLAAPQENAMSDVHYFGENESAIEDVSTVTDEDTSSGKTGTCVYGKPGLALASVAPGGGIDSDLRYSISLTNNDHPACADSRFDLTITFLPDGWKGRLSDRQLYLSPGKSGKAILAVKRSPNIPAGNYKFQLGVSDTRSPEHVMTSMTRYVINDVDPPRQ